MSRSNLPALNEYTLLSGQVPQPNSAVEFYPYGDHLYNIEQQLKIILDKLNEFEKVKFRTVKPRKPRSDEHRCHHKNRSGLQCRGYKCKESDTFCFAHHTISTNDSRSDYLYARKRL